MDVDIFGWGRCQVFYERRCVRILSVANKGASRFSFLLTS